MTTLSNPNPDSMPDWYDPFAEPNTIPAGWDVSDLISKKTSTPSSDKRGRVKKENELPDRVVPSLN